MENTQQIIEEYLRGQLGPDQVKEFEQRLTSDAEFRALYDENKDIQVGIAQAANKDLKAHLQGLEKAPVAVGKSSTKWGMVLIVGLLLLGLGYLVGKSIATNSQPTHEQLFADNFKSYPNELVRLDRSVTGSDSNMKKMMLSYQEKDFQAVIDQADNFVGEENFQEIEFYKAVSLLATNKTDEAIEIFSRLKDVAAYKFSDATSWYLGLAYLQNNELNKMTSVFEKMKADGIEYQRTAVSKILEEVKEME